MKDYTYRAIFRTGAGALVALDFYATSKGLATDHAIYVAWQGIGIVSLKLVKLTRVAREAYNPGSFYPVSEGSL
jgi:hypothetical protein